MNKEGIPKKVLKVKGKHPRGRPRSGWENNRSGKMSHNKEYWKTFRGAVGKQIEGEAWLSADAHVMEISCRKEDLITLYQLQQL
jgi:hypothetical protein